MTTSSSDHIVFSRVGNRGTTLKVPQMLTLNRRKLERAAVGMLFLSAIFLYLQGQLRHVWMLQHSLSSVHRSDNTISTSSRRRHLDLVSDSHTNVQATHSKTTIAKSSKTENENDPYVSKHTTAPKHVGLLSTTFEGLNEPKSPSFVTNELEPLFAVSNYTQTDISRFLLKETDWGAIFHILIFENGQFHIYNLYRNKWQRSSCKCKQHLLELIVESLLTARPQRFTSTSLPWQMLLDINRDNVHYQCMDKKEIKCRFEDDHSYPPSITIASVFRTAKSLTPFLVQLPTIQYNECIYHMRHPYPNGTTESCELQIYIRELANVTDEVWASLTPQVYWRGSDLGFLPSLGVWYPKCADVMPRPGRGNLTWTQIADSVLGTQKRLLPRCYAAILSAKLEEEWLSESAKSTQNFNTSRSVPLPWIDVKFAGKEGYHKYFTKKGYDRIVGSFIPSSNMSRYKYQIDFGGIGGTTWRGTITKLAMPGLLFHHETVTKDLFFDEIQPWVHYVPIHTNLSNLYDMFIWAETHPDEAKRIAQQGQQYAREHVSTRRLQATFEHAIVEPLRHIVDAYEPLSGQETLASILQRYSQGFNISLTATCNAFDAVKCKFFMLPDN